MKRLLFALTVAVLVTGCGPSRQSAPVAAVHDPIPAGQARVIIARKSNVMVAQAVKMTVRRDGAEVGEIAPGGYLAWDQEPGKTTIDVEGEPIYLTLQADKVTCVQLLVGASLVGRGIHLMVMDSGNYDQLISTYEAPEK